jgi:tripartite-type tricarboxylate transporter receptor subunit TctC
MRPTTPRVIAAAAIAATCSTSAFGAAAVQAYPNRPLRIIVPFPPSGGTDIATRLIAQKLTDSFGQTVVVDNRPGAGANIGIGLAAKAAPDGYTILVVSSAFTVNPTLYAKPPYDAHKDFQPLTCIGSSANALAVTPSFPAKGFKEAARAAVWLFSCP